MWDIFIDIINCMLDYSIVVLLYSKKNPIISFLPVVLSSPDISYLEPKYFKTLYLSDEYSGPLKR